MGRRISCAAAVGLWVAVLGLGAGGPAGADPVLGGAAGTAARPGPVHEVRAGETLWQIASHSIGDATLWPAIYRANRDQIKDPTRLYPGQRLTIPEVAPESREQIREEAKSLLSRLAP